nr:uncharacterized protein LOC112705798 [Arachis hypogaea]
MVDVTVDEAEADIINVDGFEKLITDLTIKDIWGLVFDTESQVCEFYAKYTKCYGFVSRKDLKTVDANGNINTRQLVCNKAGERHWKQLKRDNRHRKHRAITRVNCRARIRFIRHYIEQVSGKSVSLRVNTIINCVHLSAYILLPQIVGLMRPIKHKQTTCEHVVLKLAIVGCSYFC